MTTRGFTLIETLVYLALFSIAVGGLIVSAFYLIDSGAKNQALIAIQEEGTFLNRKLAWAIASASDASLIGTQELRLTRPDLAGETPLIVRFDATLQTITLTRSTGPALPLGSSEFEVSDVTFSVTHEPNRPTYVGARFYVEGKPFRLDIYLRE